MKKHIIFSLLLIFIGMMLAIPVNAETVKCHYDICTKEGPNTPQNGFIIEYDSGTGKLESYKEKSDDRYCVVNTDDIKATSFVKDGKLTCPKLYITYKGSTGGVSQFLHSSKVKDSLEANYNSSKSTIPTIESSPLKVCNFTIEVPELGNLQLSVTVNTKEKKIVGYTIPGKTVTGTLKYEDVIKNNACSLNENVYVICDTINGKTCGVINNSEPSPAPEPEPEPEPVDPCEILPQSIKDWIEDTLNLVKYVALALVIVLGVLDFIKAAGSGEADQMKKSGQSFLKRIIAVVILFLVPLIVELIINLIELYGTEHDCFGLWS